jgi:hypothetical protein
LGSFSFFEISVAVNKRYFLGCRDAARVCCGLGKSEAALINHALVQLNVIRPLRPGEQMPGGDATEYQYLLPRSGESAKKGGGLNL